MRTFVVSSVLRLTSYVSRLTSHVLRLPSYVSRLTSYGIIIISCILTASTAHAWWNGSWQNRSTLTFDNSGQASNLTDVPVLVVLNSSRLSYAATQNNGEDIRFVDSDDATELDYEIESWNEAGTSYVWVKVPQINASSNADLIYLYYNNTGAADGQDAAGTWSNAYAGVWHLDEGDSTAADYYQDSTASNNDGQLTDANGNTNAATGIAGGAIDFNGDEDLIDVGANIAFGSGPFTIEAWYRGAQNTPFIAVTGAVNGGGTGYALENHQTHVRGYINSIAVEGDTTNISDTGWHYLAMTRDAWTQQIYSDAAVDEGSQDNASNGNTVDTAITTKIGNYDVSAGTYIDGIVDEVRYSATNRSEDWVAAQYLSGTDTFITYGEAESGGGGSGYETGYVKMSDVTLNGVKIR